MVNLLVVEDQMHNMRLIEQIIEEIDERILVDRAFSGQEALTRADNRSYDLVLMDIALPEMDGMQTTRELRKMHHFRSVPILAVTAYCGEQDKYNFRQVFDDYISKPLDEDKLIGLIKKWLGDKLK